MLSIVLAAALLAAPAAAKPAPAQAAAPAATEAAQKAAESAASAAESAAKAAAAAAHAAESAAKAADKAATAADKAAAAAEKVSAPPAPAPAAAAPPAPAAPAAPPAPKWAGTLGFGTIFLTGNAETLTFTGSLALERKSEDWIVGIKGGGAFGQTTVTNATTGNQDNQVTAYNADVMVRGDRRFNPVFSAYLQGGILTDHIASIRMRPKAEAGASVIWFDVKEGDLAKTSLKTDLGFVYGHEYRRVYFPVAAGDDAGSVAIIAPHLGASYRYAISKEIIFTDDVDLTVNVVDTTRAIINDVAKLAARLTETINLAVGFKLNYDTSPAANKKGLDTATLISLELAL